MKSILIDVHHSEYNVCLLEDGILQEFYLERRHSEKRVGSIYKGKVQNVLLGMQACFVDIGMTKNAFLYAGDICVDGKMLSHDGSVTPTKFPLKEGDIILCQVLKDEFGSKGCRVTMNISIPSHNLVMLPLVDHVCASRKIADLERKTYLEKYVTDSRVSNYGYIIRTEAEPASDGDVMSDLEQLDTIWQNIKKSYLEAKCGTMIYSDGSLITRTMRDILRADVDSVIVNDQETLNYIKTSYPNIYKKSPKKFQYYKKPESMLSHYAVQSQLDGLAERKVELSNGAYLVIDKTEALTIIDVNTGKYVGEVSLEETVYITNKIAAREIARQLRLRNIGGIILIDFIDMHISSHKEELLGILSEEFKRDSVKCLLIGMTELGLVQITRKKSRITIDGMMLQECPYCSGNGVVFSEEYMIMKIRDYLVEMFSVNPHVTAVKIFVNERVFAKIFSLRYLENECSTIWAEKRIYMIPDANYHIEKYKVEKVMGSVIDLPNVARMLY